MPRIQSGLFFPTKMLLVAMGVISSLSATRLNAQDSARVSKAMEITTTADTGRMAWGHQDFSRYTTPSQCDRAIQDVRNMAFRTNERAGQLYAIENDTQPTAVTLVARKCAARFQVGDVDQRDLWSLFRVSLILKNQTQSQQIITRFLSSAKTIQDSADILSTAAREYMGASPPHVEQTQALLARLETLGDGARIGYYNTLSGLLSYWNLIRDTLTLKQQIQKAIALIGMMTPTQRDLVYVFTPYEYLFSLANESGDLTAQQQVLDTVLHTLSPWRNGTGANWVRKYTPLLETRKDLYGKRLKPISGPFWFNNQGGTHPAPGKPSLIVHASHLDGLRAFSVYTIIKDLNAQFSDQLDITMVVATQGYALGTGPLDSVTEAQHIEKYFLGFHQLPVSLLVEITPMTKDAEGAIQRGFSPLGGAFNGWSGFNALLTDCSGRVIWAGNLFSGTDKQIVTASIDRARNGVSTAEQPSGCT